MALFTPKSRQQIVADMASLIAAETPITDFTPGSVILTILEAAAGEDFQQYVQMLHIIRNYNLDTTEGEDLDTRAAEYGLTRKTATTHSGFITVSDSRFTKIATKLYAGLPGPTVGSTVIYVDDASAFPISGTLYIGRGTANTEGPVSYSLAPVDNTSYWAITLDSALIKDHGTDETIILGQYGNRTIGAGTEVEVPENDYSGRILFEINQNAELLDGEDTIESILVTAILPGGTEIPSNSVISFPNQPFTGAAVTNPLPFINGSEEETDQELRDRIRNTIQSLSRGTSKAIETGILGLIDPDTNQSVVSANIIPPVVLADGPTKVFIDNGRGLEPSLDSIGLETVITQATGGEQFFQLQNFPIMKSNLISQNFELFNLVGGETLVISVGTNEETFTFAASDFSVLGSAEANEVSQAINNRATLIEARTITDNEGTKIIITPRARTNENLRIDASSTANAALNLSDKGIETLKLYKNDRLLTKDGLTASVLSSAQPFNLGTTLVTSTDGDITVTSGSSIVTKAVAGVNPFNQLLSPGDYIKFSTDSDTFYVKVRTVISDVKLLLDAPYNANGGGLGNITIWNSPQLEVASNGDLEETEIISFGPNDFGNPAQALASEVHARLAQDLNLSKVELAVNNSKVKLISNLENSSSSKMQIVGGQAALSLGFCTVSPLTGTITVTGGSNVVTGTGTLFLEELSENQWIKCNLDGEGAWTKVLAIESNTKLYLTEGYRGEDRVLAATSKINFGVLASGADSDYVLNRFNGQLELLNPLLAGESLTAGSINTRALVDSIAEVYDFDSLGASSTLVISIDGGFPGTVSTGDAAIPYNNFYASDLIGYDANLFTGYHLKWVSGNNAGETSYVGAYNNITGEIATISAFTNPVLITDKFVLSQVINFTHAVDFVDPQNATALEVVDAINNQLLGGKAELVDDNAVRLRTSNFGETGSIQVITGSANQVLVFDTTEVLNQDTNLAFNISQNSDRGGNPNALGYTLGPDQSIVMILDNDSANKTFSINMSISGVTTAAGVGTFTAPAIGSNYILANYFKDFYIYWTSGPEAGKVQTVTNYSGITGIFTVANVFPASIGSPGVGSTFKIVPRTAENVVKTLNDLKVTTLSIAGTSEVTGISGDYVQLSTQTPGSKGKIYITGGSANSIGITIQSIPAGAPVNDVATNSIVGLAKGLMVKLTVDGEVTTGDNTIPYNSFIDTSMISAFPAYFTGMSLEFLSGNNKGSVFTIASYNNVTGQITLGTSATNAINLGDTYRISKDAFINDITGTSAPYTVKLVDSSNVAYDVSGFIPQRDAAIRDKNGLNFTVEQLEGVDGYKYATGLIQKVQWTIDGIDHDSTNYPGIGAAGTQFEVLAPVLVKLKMVVNVTTNEGISLSSISGSVSNAILEYVNSLGVGDDVVLSEIVAKAQSISGVFDVEISNYSSNIIIADGELARLDSQDLVIG